MKRLAASTVLSVWACATAGSGSAPPGADRPKGPAISDYVRLDVGSRRTYRMRFLGQEGERTVQVVGTDDGWVVDDQGGAFRITEDGLRDRERYLIRTPLEPGTTWRSVLGASAVERYRIASVGAPCQVAAGRFSDCLVVEGRLRRDPRMTLRLEWTWIRGVGLGRIESWAVVDGETRPATTQELVAYDLSAADGTTP